MKKLFNVEFEGVWPVGCCLIILADDKEEAKLMAKKTIMHTKEFIVSEVGMTESKVVIYLNGDY